MIYRPFVCGLRFNPMLCNYGRVQRQLCRRCRLPPITICLLLHHHPQASLKVFHSLPSSYILLCPYYNFFFVFFMRFPQASTVGRVTAHPPPTRNPPLSNHDLVSAQTYPCTYRPAVFLVAPRFRCSKYYFQEQDAISLLPPSAVAETKP